MTSSRRSNFCCPNLKNTESEGKPIFFVGIFDGFGGDIVADYMAQNVPKYIGRRKYFPKDVRRALKIGILSVNKKFLKKAAKSVLKDRESNKEHFMLKSFLRTRQRVDSSVVQYHTAGSTAVFMLVETVSATATSKSKGLILYSFEV